MEYRQFLGGAELGWRSMVKLQGLCRGREAALALLKSSWKSRYLAETPDISGAGLVQVEHREQSGNE